MGQNHFVDAPTVEKWLIDNAPPGVDTRRDTIFFVNWWGRSDFIDHVYTKFGEPDPDTGFDFGVNNDSRKVIAWGGTTPDDEETGLGARGARSVDGDVDHPPGRSRDPRTRALPGDLFPGAT